MKMKWLSLILMSCLIFLGAFGGASSAATMVHPPDLLVSPDVILDVKYEITPIFAVDHQGKSLFNEWVMSESKTVLVSTKGFQKGIGLLYHLLD